MKAMVSLIGEQPIPNLLPIKYEKSSHVVLVYTDLTKRVCDNLIRVLEPENKTFPMHVSPFDISEIRLKIRHCVQEQGWDASCLIFNLTGGTKAMMIAAYEVAREMGCPVIYLQSQGAKSFLHRHRFSEEGLEPEPDSPEEIPGLLTLDEYLRAHLGDFQATGFGHPLEEKVYTVLKPHVSEIKAGIKHGGAVDIDLAMRWGNQVGIAEVKTGRKAKGKGGIDQLTTAGARAYLGTYTKRFLILDRELGSDLRELAEMHNITVIELPSAQSGDLSEADKKKLIAEVTRKLGKE